MRAAGPTSDLGRPIRVVVFGGGPGLQRDCKRFIHRLADHPEIDFRAAVCQSQAQSWQAVVADLWRRRGLLAIPLLLQLLAGVAARHLSHPLEERRLNRRIRQLDERIHFVPDIHADQVLQTVSSLAPDLGLIYGSPILKPELFEIPALGTLGIHHGKVPEYRGKKTTFWAMYHGESTAGVTIQRVNAKLDGGDIVKTGEVTIGRRSLRSVWNELEALGFELYVQAVVEFKRGTAKIRPQTGKKRKLCRDPKPQQLLAFGWRQFKRRVWRR